MSPSDPTNLAALVGSVTDDPEVKARVKRLAMRAVTEAENLMRTGTPAVRVQVVKALLPVLARSLQTQDEDAHTKALRDEMRAMWSDIQVAMTSLPLAPTPDDLSAYPTDDAPQ